MRLNPFLTILLTLIPSVVAGATGEVAYLAFTENYWQVWSMNNDGSHQQQITFSDYDKSHISWYPDGKYLLVNGNQGEVRKIDVVTKKETNIKLPIQGTTDASISPDGTKIVFSLSVADSRDNNHVWIVGENGEHLEKITNMGGLQHEPVLSFDGQWVYFLSGAGDESHDIWRVSLKSKSTEQLTSGQLYHFDVAVSQDNKLAYSNNRSGNYDIWIREKGKDRNLTKHEAFDARPSWSMDGKQIMFESSRSGVLNIWRISDKGGNPTQLTHHTRGARYPVWQNIQISNKQANNQ